MSTNQKPLFREYLDQLALEVPAEVLDLATASDLHAEYVATVLEQDNTAEVMPATKPARKSFTRSHTAEADRQARALCRSIAKGGKPDEANYLLHHWFPRKSSELIARAYEKAKQDGAHVVLDMLAYERKQLTKYGSWDGLPRNVRVALS